MESPDFWNDQEAAQATIQSLKPLNAATKPFDDVGEQLEELDALLELAGEEGGAEMLPEVEQTLRKLDRTVASLEFQAMMNQPADASNAYVTIQAGEGGTEACDWALMLYRMYGRWAEKSELELEELDIGAGEQAGVRSVTFAVRGPYMYGKLRGESGVHRLVRISPFDSAGRRQTSFASVDVLPEVDDDIDIEIDEGKITMETFMSGGPGGQHQNKTASGVRLRYTPEDFDEEVVVECRNERSQHKNRATAMKMLKSRLYTMEEDRRQAEIDAHHQSRAKIGFGSQIRSYVLHPYRMVKDLRTEEETGNTDAVLDGDIDRFIEAYLKGQMGAAKE